jgi:hypothetical protein
VVLTGLKGGIVTVGGVSGAESNERRNCECGVSESSADSTERRNCEMGGCVWC